MNYITNNYKKKSIQNLKSGDILLHPIYRSDGLLLVNQYKELSSSLIDVIQKHSPLSSPVLVVPSELQLQHFLQHNIHEKQQFKEDLKQVSDDFNQHTTTKINYHPKLFSSSKNNEIHHILNILSTNPLWSQLESKLESEQLKNRAFQAKRAFLLSIKEDQMITKLFYKIKNYNDILFIHSINVTCISLMIGLTLELNLEDLKDLALSALFSNIGLTELPKEDFKKVLLYQVFDKESISKYLNIIRDMRLQSPHLRKKSIIFGILDQHEHYGGTGKPTGKKGDNISLFGRILSIANAYDDLVGGYRSSHVLSPIKALKQILEDPDGKFDQDILKIFLHRTVYFKIGQQISLSNNLVVEIIGFENYIRYPYLPIVKLKNGTIVSLINGNLI